MESRANKAIGWGSLSLLLFTVSVLFSYLTVNKKVVGEHILNYLRLDIHEAFITVALLILAVILGRRFSDQRFAKGGTVLSIVLLSMFALAITVGIIKKIVGIFQ